MPFQSRPYGHAPVVRSVSIDNLAKTPPACDLARVGFLPAFEKEYPGIEKNKYIEADHLMPVSNLKGNKISRNPTTDFAVLCQNCHRMIHRFPEPWDLAAFRKTLRQGGQAS
jgi:5-methylcytosine-specific restriction enzyme A